MFSSVKPLLSPSTPTQNTRTREESLGTTQTGDLVRGWSLFPPAPVRTAVFFCFVGLPLHERGKHARLLSSIRNTLLVRTHTSFPTPKQVKVIHKWPRPPLFSGGGGGPAAAAAAAAGHLPPPCLSWGPPQPSAARAQAPPMALLARGWGNSIQILAATRVDAGGRGGAGAGRGGARWPGLAVVKELSASAPVVAVEWLREQVIGGGVGRRNFIDGSLCPDDVVYPRTNVAVELLLSYGSLDRRRGLRPW